jgi:hypothetical protein
MVCRRVCPTYPIQPYPKRLAAAAAAPTELAMDVRFVDSEVYSDPMGWVKNGSGCQNGVKSVATTPIAAVTVPLTQGIGSGFR